MRTVTIELQNFIDIRQDVRQYQVNADPSDTVKNLFYCGGMCYLTDVSGVQHRFPLVNVKHISITG